MRPRVRCSSDCSTIDVDSARAGRPARRGDVRGFEMIDAPVSGGTGGAEAATLTFMVGGQATAFSRARPCLEAMGRNIVHTGGPGNGQVAKICNNMILGMSMIAVCESFSMAEKLGLDAQTLFNVTATSSSQCWAMTQLPAGARSGSDLARQSRLSAGIHHGNDGKRHAVGTGGGRNRRGTAPNSRPGLSISLRGSLSRVAVHWHFSAIYRMIRGD